MGSTLPMFPLGTVVFPGATLALRIFEDRYIEMVRHLQQKPPEDQRFGIVMIREAYEVGDNNVQSAHRLGCEVSIASSIETDDGYDIEVVGTKRIMVEDATDDPTTFVWGEVEYLPEAPGADADDAATRAHAVFEAYRTLLTSYGATDLGLDLPTEPGELSYALSASARLTLRDRQGLLEAPDDATRLRQISRLLVSELAAMRAIPSLPAIELARSSWSPN